MLPPTILSRFKAGEKIEVDLKIIKVRKKDDVEKERVLVMAEMDAVKRDSAIIAREASNVEKILVQDINDYNEGKLKDKLKSTPNGVEYMVHQPGNGAACAKDKIVMVYYLGMLVEGAKKFDSSFDRGSGFPFRMGGKSVIPGWEEGISPLKEGDDATIFIPASLGYGDKGAGEKIPPGARLAFYIHVRKVI
jgi:FKBP-type peptidyl-prolyl cis-trans isomerase